MSRALWLCAALFAAVLPLASCTTLPDSGPVKAGSAPTVAANEEFVRPLVDLPAPDATPEEVVEGFLTATTSPQDNYAVARTYLTQEAASTWQPSGEVEVRTDASLQTSFATGVVDVQFTQVSTITSKGVLLTVPAENRRRGYTMTQVEGQWRIVDPPEPLLLSQRDVERGYRQLNAYFLSPDGALVVPDARLVQLGQAEALATTAVRNMLAGPAASRIEAVRSAVPGGLDLALSAVPVADGIARVDFTDQIRDLPDDSLEQFLAQLAWTLEQVPGVSQMLVSAQGAVLRLPSSPNPADVDGWPEYDPDVGPGSLPLLGVDDQGRAVEWVGNSPQVLGQAAEQGPLRSVSASAGAGFLVMVPAARDRLIIGPWDDPGQRSAVVKAEIGTSVSVDRRGRLWWADRDGRLMVAVPDVDVDAIEDGSANEGSTQQQPVAFVVRGVRVDVAGEVTDVEISRDGTRIALIVGSGQRSQALLANVAGTDEAPVVTTPVVVGSPGALDLSWRSAQTLTVLHGAQQPRLLRFDLFAVEVLNVPAEPSAAAITDSPLDDPVLVVAGGAAVRSTPSELVPLEGLTQPRYRG